MSLAEDLGDIERSVMETLISCCKKYHCIGCLLCA